MANMVLLIPGVNMVLQLAICDRTMAIMTIWMLWVNMALQLVSSDGTMSNWTQMVSEVNTR